MKERERVRERLKERERVIEFDFIGSLELAGKPPHLEQYINGYYLEN